MDQLVTIYSRPGCHLCEDMKAIVARTIASLGAAAAIEEIDISTDPELEARYGTEIPVLLIDGRKIAKYRITADELTRAITSRRSGGSGRPGG
jgi:glutaredoxin